jgi:hypothetical protein
MIDEKSVSRRRRWRGGEDDGGEEMRGGSGRGQDVIS